MSDRMKLKKIESRKKGKSQLALEIDDWHTRFRNERLWVRKLPTFFSDKHYKLGSQNF